MSAKFLGVTMPNLSKSIGQGNGQITKINNKYIGVLLADAERATVVAALAAAASGDHIFLPTDSVTWETSVTVTTPVSIRGNGSGNTIITGTVEQGTPILEYSPAAATSVKFRVTGVTLTGDCIPIALYGIDGDNVIENVRIDHCVLENTGGDVNPGSIEVTATFYGVVDHNTITGMISNEQGGGYDAFDALPDARGTGDNLYFEDNTIHSAYGVTFTSGHGSRYVVRYNTIHNTKSSSMPTMFDVHGNMSGYVPTNMVFEAYGNSIECDNANPELGWLGGGKNLLFYNLMSNRNAAAVYNEVFEYHTDGLWYVGTVTGNGSNFTFTGAILPGDLVDYDAHIQIVYGTGLGQDFAIASETGAQTGTISGTWSPNPSGSKCSIYYTSGTKGTRIQHVNKTYVWNNKGQDGNTIDMTLFVDCFYYSDGTEHVHNSPATIVEDSEWFHDHALEGGEQAHGVGVGAVDSRPANCTSGVGYWESAVTSLTNLVGANHSQNISGILYVADGDDNWVVHYTPYTYPHPLTLL